MALLATVMEELESEEDVEEQSAQGLLPSEHYRRQRTIAGLGRRTIAGLGGVALIVVFMNFVCRHVGHERAAPDADLQALDGKWGLDGLQHAAQTMGDGLGNFTEGAAHAAHSVRSELGGLTNETLQTVQGELGEFTNRSETQMEQVLEGHDAGGSPKMNSQDTDTTTSTTTASALRGVDGQWPWQRLEPLQHAVQSVEGQLTGITNRTTQILAQPNYQNMLNKTLKEGLDFVGIVSNSTSELSSEGLSLQLRHALSDVGLEAGNLQQQADELRQEITSLTSDDSCSLDGLFFDKVIHSNLGGHGPDIGEQSLILESNRTENGLTVRRLEFKVTANSPYNPGLPTYNGITHGLVGRYGTIVVMPGSSVNLTFRVLDMETGEPVLMPSVAYTFFDLDEFRAHAASEFIQASGFTRVETTEDTEVVRTVEADGTTNTFQASTPGTFDDNPVDPMLLTEEQKNRAVTLHYSHTDAVSVIIGATPGSSSARAFTFVAHPVLQCAKTIGATGSREPVKKQGSESIMLRMRRMLPVLLGGLLVLVMIACLAAAFFLCC